MLALQNATTARNYQRPLLPGQPKRMTLKIVLVFVFRSKNASGTVSTNAVGFDYFSVDTEGMVQHWHKFIYDPDLHNGLKQAEKDKCSGGKT